MAFLCAIIQGAKLMEPLPPLTIDSRISLRLSVFQTDLGAKEDGGGDI